MRLEQRVEALEKALKVFFDSQFTIDRGQVFIDKALIKNSKIKATRIQAAEVKNYNATMEIAVSHPK